MSKMVRGVGPEIITVDIPFKIARNRKDKNVLTKSETKDYRVVDNKRIIVNNSDTLPYGF